MTNCKSWIAMSLIALSVMPLLGEGHLKAQPVTDAQNVSAECAHAIRRAISDYETWHLSHRVQEDFLERFLKSFDAVKCTKEVGGFQIYFAPTSTVTRGGGVIYLLALDSFEVIERVFER